MKKQFGLWLTILFTVISVGCVPVIAEPTATESAPTVLDTPDSVLDVLSTPGITPSPTAVISQEALPIPTKTPTAFLTQSVVKTPTPEETPPPNRVIVVAGGSEVYQIKVGQDFTFQGPRGADWQIGYDQEFLTLLTSEGVSQQAGDSWEFQAKQQIGRTRIWLTNLPPSCVGEFCPPPAASIQLDASIEIVQN